MKKFTQINENNIVEKLTINERILNLLETLDIDIIGDTEPWTGDIKINPSEDFYNGFKKLINESFTKEKMILLENAKTSIKTKDISWIDDEIDKIKKK